jgi:hypothetical protein
MQKLETEIMLSSRILRQVKRGKRCALYSVHNKAGTLYGHEVIRIKVAEPMVAFEREYPLRELYPGNEEWGRLAWSYGTQQTAEAEKAFECLLRQENFRNGHTGGANKH